VEPRGVDDQQHDVLPAREQPFGRQVHLRGRGQVHEPHLRQRRRRDRTDGQGGQPCRRRRQVQQRLAGRLVHGADLPPAPGVTACPAMTTTDDEAAGPTEWGGSVGVGPWAGPWPADPRYDRQLLADGDRRNVVDRYRYWTLEAIVADLDARRHPFHVAIENFEHDLNIGTVVRTANAFLAAEVHVVGRRRWNRRGAMVTDRYQHLRHHADVAGLLAFAAAEDLAVVAVDNGPDAVPLETVDLPRRCLLLFGQEGPGLTAAARAGAGLTVSISQFGSTRSLNAGVAAGIAMHAWVRRHADLSTTREPVVPGA
jgi:tRNA(Leu) C34 or U34 (ribose-2'-O)-methylase TrmL